MQRISPASSAVVTSSARSSLSRQLLLVDGDIADDGFFFPITAVVPDGTTTNQGHDEVDRAYMFPSSEPPLSTRDTVGLLRLHRRNQTSIINANHETPPSPADDGWLVAPPPRQTLTAASLHVLEKEYDRDTWRMYLRIQSSRQRVLERKQQEERGGGANITQTATVALPTSADQISHGSTLIADDDNGHNSRRREGVTLEGETDDDVDYVSYERDAIFELDME